MGNDCDNDYSSWSQAGVIAGYNQQTYDWAEFYLGYFNGLGDRVRVKQYDRFLNNANSPIIGADTKQAFYEKWSSSCEPYYSFPCEQSLVGSTLITDTNFNPFAQTYWTNGSNDDWSPQYFGEKTYPGSDIMGSTSDHTNFTDIGVQEDNSSNDFIFEPCVLSLTMTASRSKQEPNGCEAFDVWTDPSS